MKASSNFAAAAIALSVVLGAGSAFAAEAMKCCCKDAAGKIACCDKMKGDKAAPADHSEHRPSPG